MPLAKAAGALIEQCEVVSRTHKHGKALKSVLGYAKSALGGYSDDDLAEMIVADTSDCWEKLAALPDTKDVGKLVYDFTKVFKLKTFSPQHDTMVREVLHGELDTSHRDSLNEKLRDMVKTTIVHIHGSRDPRVDDGEKAYNKKYMQSIRVLHWAKRFRMVEDLKFHGESKPTEEAAKKRKHADEEEEEGSRKSLKK